MNAKPRRVEVFIPGDLVYYRRFKTPPLYGQHLSHPGLDVTGKPQVSRWYGPARVLATESKSEQGVDFDTRRPANVVWIIAAEALLAPSTTSLQ